VTKPAGIDVKDWVAALEHLPLRLRSATPAERAIAKAWVDRFQWSDAWDEEAAFAYVLAILVFGNARPPLKNRRGRA
jgi:hypothetical protein